MENLTLKISETTTREVTLPRYFLRSKGDYYKLIDEKKHINVVYHGEEVLNYSVYLFPKIVMYGNFLLHNLQVNEIIEISEDEFYTAYYQAKNLIEKLAEI